MLSTDYCREIEAYLCRKNDGHLIRVVGPSFELVSQWADEGVPIKVAFSGIDRYFERYYRKGPRRRPVRIDSCEADVRDVFDEWRRAVGVTAAGLNSGTSADSPDGGDESVVPGAPAASKGTASLPAHLERAIRRLTSARATGRIGEAVDPIIDQLSGELDRAKASPAGLRGATRQELLSRLAAMDDQLISVVREALDRPALDALERDAEAELAGFRDRMAPEAFSRARAAAATRLLRERFGLPTLTV